MSSPNFLSARISQRSHSLSTIHLRSLTIVRPSLLEYLPADIPAELVAYQYDLRVVPSTYVAPRVPLHTISTAPHTTN